jgi:hypothetical protein
MAYPVIAGCPDTQDNGTHHGDTQHKGTKHKGTQYSHRIDT